MMQHGGNPFGITCRTCGSDQLQDDGEGMWTCRDCATLSQDFLAETFDGDDIGNVYAARQSVRRLSRAPKYRSAILPSKPQGVDANAYELLLCYQSSLQLLLRAALPLILPATGYESFESILTKRLKSLWMQYLRKWQESDSSCNISSAFTRSLQCTCDGKLRHPHFPSRPLLLGFLYLCFRQERLDVLPCNIVQWCERGLLPYANLWEALPDTLRAKLDKRHRWLFFEPHVSKTRFVSPTNVWFHCNLLAADLALDIPPLNAPLVARSLVLSLGLPDCVWTRYAQIARLGMDGTPLSGLELELMHGGEVMAAIVLAVMLCEGWQQWSLVHSPVEATDAPLAVPQPANLPEISSLSRDQAMALVTQARRCNHHYATTSRRGHSVDQSFAYNEAVLRVLGANLHPTRGEVAVSQEEGIPTKVNPTLWTIPAALSSDLSVSRYALLGEGAIHDFLSGGKRSYLQRLVAPKVSPAQRERGCVPYVCYSRNLHDTTGLYHMAYIALIERAARHLYMEPLVLHKLVEKLDGQILQLAVEGKVSTPFSTHAYQLKRMRLLAKRVEQCEEKLVHGMAKPQQRAVRILKKQRTRAERLLPFAHAVGLADANKQAAAARTVTRLDGSEASPHAGENGVDPLESDSSDLFEEEDEEDIEEESAARESEV